MFSPVTVIKIMFSRYIRNGYKDYLQKRASCAFGAF